MCKIQLVIDTSVILLHPLLAETTIRRGCTVPEVFSGILQFVCARARVRGRERLLRRAGRLLRVAVVCPWCWTL